jgi:hypothetical protein
LKQGDLHLEITGNAVIANQQAKHTYALSNVIRENLRNWSVVAARCIWDTMYLGYERGEVTMSPPDPVFHAFLRRQAEEGMALAQASDILDLECLPTGQHFIAHYSCRGLVKGAAGIVQEADTFQVGVFLGADYLRHPTGSGTWLAS